MDGIEHDKSLAEVIGRAVRKLREGSGGRLDDVAKAARNCGLRWSTGSVTDLEAGRRHLTAAELILLPGILEAALGQTVRMQDLLPDGPIVVQESPQRLVGLSGQTVRRILAGEDAHVPRMEPAIGDAEVKAARRLGWSPVRVFGEARELWGRSLSAERDERVASRAAGKDARTLQALRGHVTRELLTELQEASHGKR